MSAHTPCQTWMVRALGRSLALALALAHARARAHHLRVGTGIAGAGLLVVAGALISSVLSQIVNGEPL